MDERATRQNPSHLLDRVRAVLKTLKLDCRCQSKLNEALERFEEFEKHRQVRALILDARNQAERIAALLDFINEFDTVGIDEADLGVFDEIGFLFTDIGLAAACGAEDMARVKGFASGRQVSTIASGGGDGR